MCFIFQFAIMSTNLQINNLFFFNTLLYNQIEHILVLKLSKCFNILKLMIYFFSLAIIFSQNIKLHESKSSKTKTSKEEIRH